MNRELFSLIFAGFSVVFALFAVLVSFDVIRL